MSDDILTRFRAEIGANLDAGDQRLQSFEFIVNHLASLGRPIRIVETGCARQPGNWGGDGQSTVIWDWLIGVLGGSATSYDISPASVAAATSLVTRVVVVQQDSIVGLRGEGDPQAIDLLYLDSYDLAGGLDSPVHHLAELASIYTKLRSGCLIAVDDCIGEGDGKHILVARFLKSLGVLPIFTGYVTVWQKP